MAILDTNCDPASADLPIPGNDDAARAIQLYCDLIADAVLDGMTEAQANVGVDLGAAENPMEMAMAAKAETAPAPAAEPAPAVEVAAPAAEAATPVVEAAPVVEAVPEPEPVEAAPEPAAKAAPAEASEEESEYLRVTREYDADVDPAIVTKLSLIHI